MHLRLQPGTTIKLDDWPTLTQHNFTHEFRRAIQNMDEPVNLLVMVEKANPNNSGYPRPYTSSLPTAPMRPQPKKQREVVFSGPAMFQPAAPPPMRPAMYAPPPGRRNDFYNQAQVIRETTDTLNKLVSKLVRDVVTGAVNDNNHQSYRPPQHYPEPQYHRHQGALDDAELDLPDVSYDVDPAEDFFDPVDYDGQ